MARNLDVARRHPDSSRSSALRMTYQQPTYTSHMRAAFILFVLVSVSAFGADPATAIRFGKVIDGRGGVRSNAVIVVRGNRIESIRDEVPAGATVIDLSKYTAIPGLIDAHTHMT